MCCIEWSLNTFCRVISLKWSCCICEVAFWHLPSLFQLGLKTLWVLEAQWSNNKLYVAFSFFFLCLHFVPNWAVRAPINPLRKLKQKTEKKIGNFFLPTAFLLETLHFTRRTWYCLKCDNRSLYCFSLPSCLPVGAGFGCAKMSHAAQLRERVMYLPGFPHRKSSWMTNVCLP